uniref:Uncharacterized protein n=1 Tax=Arundo donax TaxID=35708 RepID=A0A0A9BP01_ARUDO
MSIAQQERPSHELKDSVACSQ